MDRFEDGYEEWREEMSESDDWRDQRKANYVPMELRREKVLQFIERERNGGGYDKLLKQARWRMQNDELFKIDYEIENIKRGIVRRGEGDASFAKDMFKYASSSYACLVREMILEMPELADYTRIRKCKASKFYPELEEYEHRLVIDQETGGDSAA